MQSQPGIMTYPAQVLHWLNDAETGSASNAFFPKHNPATGEVIGQIARGNKEEALKAIGLAVESFESWAQTSVIARADLLRKATQLMEQRKDEIAAIVSLETGKSRKDALGEVGAAIEMGYFVAGEGRRFYGRTTTSAMPSRAAMTVRQPIGVCALIIAANTPIANVAWKVYPALLCGNTAILKASEDTPYTAIWFARLLKEAGAPAGVLTVLNGYGEEVGAPLVEDARVRVVSFTGSVPVGRWIAKTAGERLAKVCLELGGKNPLVVCDDADLDAAAQATVLSAFSNAGQRCASGSRILVFDAVYDAFKQKVLALTHQLKLGPADTDDFGPVINEKQLQNMLAALETARQQGASILTGGHRLGEHADLARQQHPNANPSGYYMLPTLIENILPQAELSRSELFGPITCLYRVRDFEEAVQIANDSPMGLTAAIHTASIHRAQRFQELCRAGVISVNGPTYGSEPHMPFGGLRDSGNGFREAGTEALDVYSDWKTVYVKHDPERV